MVKKKKQVWRIIGLMVMEQFIVSTAQQTHGVSDESDKPHLRTPHTPLMLPDGRISLRKQFYHCETQK